MIIESKEQVAEEIIETLYNIKQSTIEGFFRRTLYNMKQFYNKVDKIKLLEGV